MLDVDLKALFNTAQATEIALKKELEESTRTTTQQAEQIRSLQTEVARASEEKSTQAEQIRSLQTEVARLEKSTQAKQILSLQTEVAARLEKAIQGADPLKSQKEIEYNLREKQSQPEISVPTSTITANATEPISSLPEDSTLVKEEIRMLRAISKPALTPGAQGRARTTSDMPKAISIKLNDTFTSPRTGLRVSPVTPGPFSPKTLPEWKARQIEKEKEIMDKYEQEQLKKQEHLNAVVVSIVSSGSGVLASEEIPPSQLQLSDLSVSEKEEQRLKRALNKANSVRPFSQKL